MELFHKTVCQLFGCLKPNAKNDKICIFRDGSIHDKQNFVLLVKEFKENFEQHNLLLTSGIGATNEVISEAYDITALSKYLDFMHIMCYDYNDVLSGEVAFGAPLRGQFGLNVEYTIDYLISMGAPVSKIVMGIPFYGRSFVTDSDGNIGDQLPLNRIDFLGPFTRKGGFLGYNEICRYLSEGQPKWIKSYNTEYDQSIAKFSDPVFNQTLVTIFDSSRSIANKIKFAMSRNIAGVAAWYFHSICG